MQQTIVVQPAYFAPVVQYAAILQSDSILFEVHDNFEKQSYRNRCNIYAANGKLLLNVPVKHYKGVKTLTTDTEINYAEDWPSLHLKSLQSAYRSSPFFEFYQDDIISIYKEKPVTLGALHKRCHDFVMDALQEERPVKNTKEYIKSYTHALDLRKLSLAKQKIHQEFTAYTQVFDEKYGFIPNLSILDLLFMEGPAASIYLENLTLSNAFF
ncbi:WbqC family protein [Ochrovirga pacifica]|uniref:WbqC family protein n=1 Tax=Ochrovirga pacifica TaxID=1042376 RepID=UPI0002558389|nr:WbqC family protein [Ochrovirga pacifica]